MAKAPAFQFYTRDYFGSSRTRRMNGSERGIYCEGMFWCYEDGSIPDDPDKFASQAALDSDEVRAAWPVVRPCFDVTLDDGSITQERILKQRKEQHEFQARMKRISRAGVEAKHGRYTCSCGRSFGTGSALGGHRTHCDASGGASESASESPVNQPVNLSSGSRERKGRNELPSQPYGEHERVTSASASASALESNPPAPTPSPLSEQGDEGEDPKARALEAVGLLATTFEERQNPHSTSVPKDEAVQERELVRWFAEYFPEQSPGAGEPRCVRDWRGAIKTHRILASKRELERKVYPNGKSDVVRSWSELGFDERKRMIQHDLNGMLNPGI